MLSNQQQEMGDVRGGRYRRDGRRLKTNKESECALDYRARRLSMACYIVIQAHEAWRLD